MLGYTVPPTETAAEDVACPGGQRALGGGVSFGGSGDRVVFWEPRLGTDAPNAQGAAANGWAVCAAR